MTSTKVTFPVYSFRKVGSPYEEKGATTYAAVVNVKDIPAAIDEWRSINVRDAKLTNGVANKIRKSLTDAAEGFFFKNRGMTLMVKGAEFDNKTNQLSIEFADKGVHGLLDGGHTYSVIREYIDGLEETELDGVEAYVRIEMIEGVNDLEEVVGIVEARNTSTQVREQSLEELRGHYEEIKKVIADRPYADLVAYKEYELNDEGLKKTIDIRDLLSYLVCFDAEAYTGSKHPIIAYSSKGAVVQHFKDNKDRMKRVILLLPKILELYDHIYATLPDAYNSTGGKFGKLTDVGERKKAEKLTFTDERSRHKIPSAFIYPILASLRTLLEVKGEKYTWKADPIKFYDSIKVELAERIVNQAKQDKSPTKMGKSQTAWERCYDLARLSAFERNF